MKDAQWYYEEFDKVEKQLKECRDATEAKRLADYLDKLHDEFYKLR